MFSAPGVQNGKEIEAVISRGAGPSEIVAVAAFQPTFPRSVGPVVLDDGAGGSFTFQNCASSGYYARHGWDRGRTDVALTFLDRRWKWAYSPVSARFNERLPDCSIRFSPQHSGYRRSAREIFAYIFSGAGESGADLSGAPTNVFPECRWDSVPVSRCLAEICEKTETEILISDDNRVRVVARGIGADLPESAARAKVSCTVEFGAVPQFVGIDCGPTRFQGKLLLEAVGLDTNGHVLPVDKLSYKPAAGWGKEWPYAFPSVAQESRHLAFQTVWRWFRVKSQTDGNLRIPGTTHPVVSADQYRLLSWLVDVGVNGRMPCVLPARIYGEHWPEQDFPENTPKKTPISSSFRIIPELGIVEFPFPIVKRGDGNYAGQHVEPKLYLETSYMLAHPMGEGFVSHGRSTPTGFPTGTGALTRFHPELWQTHVLRYKADGVTFDRTESNLARIDVEVQEYLSRLRSNVIASATSTDKTYVGIQNPGLDGLRSQATFETGLYATPETRVGRGAEFDVFTYDRGDQRRP